MHDAKVTHFRQNVTLYACFLVEIQSVKTNKISLKNV